MKFDIFKRIKNIFNPLFDTTSLLSQCFYFRREIISYIDKLKCFGFLLLFFFTKKQRYSFIQIIDRVRQIQIQIQHC
jgi:hypothetical protein